MNKIVSLFGIAVTLLALGSEAQAAQKYSYRTKGNAATFSTSSSTDCGYEYLNVYVFEERTSGNQTTYDSVTVDFVRYDFCTGQYAYGYGVLDGAAFDVQKLQRASVDGSGSFELVTCDYSEGGGDDAGFVDPCTYSSVPLSVNLDWTGTGETYKDRYVQVSSTPSARYRYTQSGQSREAAVTGSVTIDGTPADLSNGYGSLSFSSSASFEIVR